MKISRRGECVSYLSESSIVDVGRAAIPGWKGGGPIILPECAANVFWISEI